MDDQPEIKGTLNSQEREQLIADASDRLMRLTRRMKRDYPSVSRWEQTEDIFQNALLRLFRALEHVEVESRLHFYRLAALQIRRELIDLSRHYRLSTLAMRGARSTGISSGDDQKSLAPYDIAEATRDPEMLAHWAEFHQMVEELPTDDREVFDLIWYAGLSHTEIAEMLSVSLKTVQRRWRSARINLSTAMGELPAE